MPIQSMQCPKCKHWATEYAHNKWQCLECHTKFVYEAPHKPDCLVQQTVSMDETGIIYVCDTCGLRFSRLTKPDQKCTRCGEYPICPDCFPAIASICRKCKKKKSDEEAKAGVIGCLVFVIIILLFMANSKIQDCRNRGEQARVAEISRRESQEAARIAAHKREQAAARAKVQREKEETARLETKRKELGLISGTQMRRNVVYRTYDELQAVVYETGSSPSKILLPKDTYILYLKTEEGVTLGQFDSSLWYVVRTQNGVQVYINPRDLFGVYEIN